MTDTIYSGWDVVYLDADLFMALGLSAEAHGGIGRGRYYAAGGAPHCVHGHLEWLYHNRCWATDSVRIAGSTGLTEMRNDWMLTPHVDGSRRVPFAEWCRIVNVDVAP